MFAFIKNIFLKSKSKKILAHIEQLETAFMFFSLIPPEEKKFGKYANALSYKERYVDVVSRYNVCVQKIKKHNETDILLTSLLKDFIAKTIKKTNNKISFAISS